MNKDTIVRTIASVVVLLNTALGYLSTTALADNLWYKIVSLVVLAATICIVGWYNNDFTKAAQFGTDVTHAIKDGKLTEDEVKALLESGNASLK